MNLKELKEKHMVLKNAKKDSLDLLLPYARTLTSSMTSDELWEFIETTVNSKKEYLEESLLDINPQLVEKVEATLSPKNKEQKETPTIDHNKHKMFIEAFALLQGEKEYVSKSKFFEVYTELSNSTSRTQTYRDFDRVKHLFFEIKEGKKVFLSLKNKNKQAQNRRYFVWKCETIIDGMKPSGKEQTPPCGEWNITTSKHNLGNSKHLQGFCSKCTRRSRLNPNTRLIHECSSSRGAKVIMSQLVSLDKAQSKFNQKKNDVDFLINRYESEE